MIHKPDEDGRMIFTASRDILAGQECCISYFDLTKFTNLASRREHLRKSFKFTCQCDRCISEEPAEETNDWDSMPLMDI
jgi:SET domain-containing protein